MLHDSRQTIYLDISSTQLETEGQRVGGMKSDSGDLEDGERRGREEKRKRGGGEGKGGGE
jgi:hypothetical protein